MNKGVILTFLSGIISSFSEWYENSILGKIGRFFGKLWTLITQKSFFVNWFTGAEDTNEYRDGSFICKALNKAAVPFKRFGLFIIGKAEKSIIFSSVKWYFDNFFHISTSHYGMFLMVSGAAYFILRTVFCGFSAVCAAVCGALIMLGILLVLINMSVSSIFFGSIARKLAFGFLNINSYEESPTINASKLSTGCFVAAGILVGVICFKIGCIYGICLTAGLVFICSVIYNFRIGVYTALIAFPFVPTMAIVGILLLTLISLVIKSVSDTNFKFKRTSLDIPIAVFLAVLLVSSVTSFARASSIKIYLVYFVFICSYYAVTNALSDFKMLIPAAAAMLVVSLGVSGYGIYQHIFGFAEGKTWTDTEMFEDIATRVVSTFDNPNVLGEYLLLLIPVGISLFLSKKKSSDKLAYAAITLALGVCMIYTYSRGNWIGLILAVFMFIMFYDTRYVWLGVIAVLAAPAVMSQSVISRFTSIGNTTDTSTSYRVYIWMGSLAMLKDYWFCGVGLGSDAFNMIYPHYSYAGVTAPHTHNLYLQLAAENGILGLIVFLVIAISYYRMVISEITKLKRGIPKALITALAAGVFGYLVQGMFDNVWYNYRVFFMFFAILGLTAAAVNASKGERMYD